MTFLPQFKACVKAGSQGLMCSYNRYFTLDNGIIHNVYVPSDYSINGVPSCANKKLLTDILRNEWDFKGTILITNAEVIEVKIYELSYTVECMHVYIQIQFTS